jgi:hypothetical protein
VVIESSRRRRQVLGVRMTTQTYLLIVAVLAVAALIGLAVLSWLEHLG